MHKSLLLPITAISLLCTLPISAQELEFPLGRGSYFQGETIPLGIPGDGPHMLTAKLEGGQSIGLYSGKAGAILLDTSRLEPGLYNLELDSKAAGTVRLVSPARKSAASLQDESTPDPMPRMDRQQQNDPTVRARMIAEHQGQIRQTLQESGITACVNLGAVESGRHPALELLAEQGVLLLHNPDSRPTSFFPVANDPAELAGMAQRLILSVQANYRYPNFGGFCYGWDPTAYGPDMRNGLMTYWRWGNQESALRQYIARIREARDQGFEDLTGMKTPDEAAYLGYVLALGRPDFAPYIDMPTRDWLYEIMPYVPKPSPAEFEAEGERIQAYAKYLMTLYNNTYSHYQAHLARLFPSVKNTASVQVDHAPTRHGQYHPSAYQSLDFRYQTAWSDQVGGPDFPYHPLFADALISIGRGDKPVWISNSFGGVHGRSSVPGKMVRTSAHGLAYGTSGNGFALEGFSNLLGGMNKHSRWESIRGTSAAGGVIAAKNFLDRFACLAVQGRGNHGVGILHSKSQLSVQHSAMGFGEMQYWLLVSLSRLGYTPRFVTEEELSSDPLENLPALIIANQTVPLPEDVQKTLRKYMADGGKVLANPGTSIELPSMGSLPLDIPFRLNGKPHNMGSPNLPPGEDPSVMGKRFHQKFAPVLADALGDTGRGSLRSKQGAETQVSLFHINGGKQATYVVAVNDSTVKTQADWHQVKETLEPTLTMPRASYLYDCTEEKAMGQAAPFECDLSGTTARVYAILSSPINATNLEASQDIAAGSDLQASVSFQSGDGEKLEVVIPFQITLSRPDGTPAQKLYRSTSREGDFHARFPIGINAPSGEWKLEVRCQLDGQVASLPIHVRNATNALLARPLDSKVFVRAPGAIRDTFRPGTEAVLPLFLPGQARLRPFAEKLKSRFRDRGMEVDIQNYTVGETTLDGAKTFPTYWMGYELEEGMKAANALVDSGEAIGRIKDLALHGNHWASTKGGYRSACPVILLADPSQKDNPMAGHLDGFNLLWPKITENFPGKDGAIVQAVHWAFGKEVPALVIQAGTDAGFEHALETLANLPREDPVSNGIAEIRTKLWNGHHIGGQARAKLDAPLSRKGFATRPGPKPFRIDFHGSLPPTAEEAREIANQPPEPPKAVLLPGIAEPKQMQPYDFVGGEFIPTSTANVLLPDLRFSKGLEVTVENGNDGEVEFNMDGLFRYSEKEPRSQAQWESILALRRKYLPEQPRRPMAVEVWSGGKVLATLLPVQKEQAEVPVETLPFYVKEKPKSVTEEVVLRVGGKVPLPKGRSTLLLVHRNIVDGRLDKIRMGVPLEAPAK
jgi:hypothetical protein